MKKRYLIILFILVIVLAGCNNKTKEVTLDDSTTLDMNTEFVEEEEEFILLEATDDEGAKEEENEKDHVLDDKKVSGISKVNEDSIPDKNIVIEQPSSPNNSNTSTTPSIPGANDTKLSYDGYNLRWEDHFNGNSLDMNNWNIEVHEPGWVNNELQ